MSKIGFLTAITLWLLVAHSSVANPVFQKTMQDGSFLQLNAEVGTNSQSHDRGKAASIFYNLLDSKGLQDGKILWSRSFFASEGFQMLDATKESDGLYVCYKLDRNTFIEHVGINQDFARISSDFFGTGLVSINAQFNHTNGEFILRLGFKNYDIRAWVRKSDKWVRSIQYDLKTPLWARNINLGNTNIIGGPLKEVFSADEYLDASWGNAEKGIQVGLQFAAHSFRMSGPITAILHVRNLSSEKITYKINKMSSSDSPVIFTITDKQNNAILCKALDIAPYVPVMEKSLDHDQQSIHPFYLDKLFSFNPGVYQVTARLKISDAKAGGGFSAVTGCATIEVVP